MIAISKLLGSLVMPLGLLWLGLLAAAIWAFRRRARGLACFLSLLTLGLTFGGNTWVGHALLARLEGGLSEVPVDPAPLEALFVLGGGTEVDLDGHPFLGETGDRIAEAARLWHAGRVRCLVASGASAGIQGVRRDLGAETRVIWMDLGIPAEAIRVVTEPCFVTRDEVQAYRRLKAQQGWTRVGLISSTWHLPRAMALAKREGLEVIPVRSHRPGYLPPFQLWHLVPQLEGLRCTQAVCWEVLGRWMGR